MGSADLNVALSRVYRLRREGNVVGLIRELENPLARGRSSVRAGAARALGELGDARAVPYLLPLLTDSRRDARMEAVEALGQLGEASVAPAIVSLLEDDDEDRLVRMVAAEALGRLRVEAAVEPLGAGLRSEDVWLQLYCAEALVAMGRAADDRATMERAAGSVPFWKRGRRKRWRRLLTSV